MKVHHIVRRFNWTKGRRENQAYLEDWGSYHLLVKVWKLWGITIWSRVVDREDIPQHVIISRATLGYSDGWRSRFEEHMR